MLTLSVLSEHFVMEDVIADKLKKERRVKKGLLTRSVNKLRSIVSRGADAQADTVDAARCRARHMLDEIDEINVQMETVLLEWDIAFEYDDEDATRPTARMADIESTFRRSPLGKRRSTNCKSNGHKSMQSNKQTPPPPPMH